MPRAYRVLPAISLSVLLAGDLIAAKPRSAALPMRTISAIERPIKDALAARQMPGATVAVAFDDGRLFSKHYGSATLKAEAPVTSVTLFRTGSISKLVTALVIMRLAEEGRLTLDAPIASIFPSHETLSRLPPAVTVRRLLNHTSGLPDYTRAELEAKVARGVVTDADLTAVLKRPLLSEPGRVWSYADAPFRILSLAIERISGLSYERYISERLAPALGLRSIRVCAPGAADHAAGYLSRDSRLLPEPAYAIRGLLGEGGLCATAEDLARLPAAAKNGSWISAASLSAMTAPTRLEGGQLVDYGLGVQRGLLGRKSAWGHTGGGPDGSWASVAHYPKKGVTIAVLANGTGGNADAATLQGMVAAAVLGVSPPDNRTPDPALARVVIGAYQRGDQTTCVVPLKGKLVRTKLGSTSAPTPLLYQGSTVFARSDYPLDRFTFQIEEGKSIGYRVYYDGLFAAYWRRSSDRACAEAGVTR